MSHYQQQIAELKQARGQRYAALFRALDADDSLGGVLRQEVTAIRDRSGKFSLNNAGELAVKYDIPIATLFRMIEAPGFVPTGTWERAQARGVKAQDLIHAAKGGDRHAS